MGYALVMSPCYGCNRLFSYNPVRVPSIRIDGVRQPICQDCVTRVNPIRKKNGLPEIVPHADAYEPVDENEVPW